MSLKDRWDLVDRDRFHDEFGEPENFTENIIEGYSSWTPAMTESVRGIIVSMELGGLLDSTGVAALALGVYAGKTYEGLRERPYTMKLVEGYQEGIDGEVDGFANDFFYSMGRRTQELQSKL